MNSSLLPEHIINDLKNLGTLINIKSQHTLVAYGSRANHIYLIISGGLVLLHVHPKTGAERAINFFIPEFHSIASSGEAFFNNTVSKYHLKSFTNTTLVKIEKEVFYKYLRDSENYEFMHRIGIKSLLEKSEIRAQIITLDSLEMLQYLHENYPQILQQVPSKYVANFLGITPQWLSKIKKKL